MIKRNKEEHIKNMTDSHVFRFIKEIVFHNVESCDSQRYVGLALSQGGLQSVLKLGFAEIIAYLDAIEDNGDGLDGYRKGNPK